MTFSIMGMPLRLERYGARLDGTVPTDGSMLDDDALAAAIADAKDRTWKTCRIQWDGMLTLTRQPPSMYRLHLEGDDQASSTISKRFAGGVLLNLNGPDGFTGGGLHNFSTPTTVFSVNSYVVLARATAGFAPDGLQLEHLYLSSGPTAHAPWRNIELSGAARNSPPGLREPWIRNVTCFGATGGNVVLSGTPKLTACGLNVYAAEGTDAEVYLTGAPGFFADDINVTACDIEGTLHLSGLSCADIQGSIGSISWETSFGECNYVTIRPSSPPLTNGAKPANCRVI